MDRKRLERRTWHESSEGFIFLLKHPLLRALAGIIAEYTGVRLTLLIGIVGLICAGLWLLLSPVSKIRTFAAQRAEPE